MSNWACRVTWVRRPSSGVTVHVFRAVATNAGSLLGLLSDVDTRTCWQLAEQAGDVSPHRMQRLLGEAVWDADKVRDDVRGYVVDELGDPNGVLILDDTGDLKKGNASVGTQRQYTGTAGRIENSQVAVFLAYASRYGYTLIDREVYLPRSWTDDPARCAAAGVPEHVRFATKITLARRMLTRAAAAGVPAAGPPRTSSTAATVHCAGTCTREGWATSSRSRKATRSPLARPSGRSVSTTSLPRSRPEDGTDTAPAKAPKATVSTTGPG